MKITLFILVAFSYGFSLPEDEELACPFELFIGTKNVNGGASNTFTVTKQGIAWDTSFNIVSGYEGGSVTIVGNSPTDAFPHGFDVIHPLTGGACNFGGTLMYGLYKISLSENIFFYIDYRDCQYNVRGQPTNYSTY